jgi:tRNA G18 (ribose-2'-O)-methylase SpoU
MAGFVAIDEVRDPRLAVFRLNERGLANRAAKRDDTGAGLFLAEGDLVVTRALDAGCAPHLGLADGERVPAVADRIVGAGADVYVGGEQLRAMVAGLGMPHSIIALFHRPPRASAADLLARCERLVVVEGVDNPGNIGSIVRNAAALGWDGLLLDHTSADPLARRALRVAMGTAFSLPHARTTTLVDDLRAAADGLTLYALTPHADATDLRTIALRANATPGRRAVLIGSERAGLSDDLLSIAVPVRIPMANAVDSLNAAAAAAVACYALA